MYQPLGSVGRASELLSVGPEFEPIKDFRCVLEQETLPSTLSTG